MGRETMVLDKGMIIERIKRKIEPGLYIVPQSTPIIYFGNYDTAKACTVSLNPSNKEFTNGSDILLDYKNKERLCSRKRLKKQDIDELTDEEVEIVLDYCKNYFTIKPFKNWFNPFNCFINIYCGYSYYEDSCVHLDLVQWATYKKWSDVPENVRQKHLKNDLSILKYLLSKNFEIMFLNGITVVNNISQYLGIRHISKKMVYRNHQGEQGERTMYFPILKRNLNGITNFPDNPQTRSSAGHGP